LAHRPEVAERINELRAELRERSQLHAEYIQRQLLPLVEANAIDLFETVAEADGETRERLRSIVDMPRELAQAVSKIKLDPETGRVTEVVLHSKLEAASVLLKSIGAIRDGSLAAVSVALTHEDALAQLGGPRVVEVKWKDDPGNATTPLLGNTAATETERLPA